MKKILTLLIATFLYQSGILAQEENPIRIVEERTSNRVMLYALNESLTDYDVILSVEGTGFKQSRNQVRPIRVPAASKVHMKNLIVMRGKQAVYTSKIELNDSLSKRSMKKPFEKIKIDPKKRIVIYNTENCEVCAELLTSLDESVYNYVAHNLAEKPEIKEQLSKIIPNLGEITTPLVSLGGKLYQDIESMEKLLEELQK